MRARTQLDLDLVAGPLLLLLLTLPLLSKARGKEGRFPAETESCSFLTSAPFVHKLCPPHISRPHLSGPFPVRLVRLDLDLRQRRQRRQMRLDAAAASAGITYPSLPPLPFPAPPPLPNTYSPSSSPPPYPKTLSTALPLSPPPTHPPATSPCPSGCAPVPSASAWGGSEGGGDE